MITQIKFRKGNAKELADEFLSLNRNRPLELVEEKFGVLKELDEDRVIAVHYAHGGAQGEPGLVRILYLSPFGIKVFSGNYVFGDLDLDELSRYLPMLKHLSGDNERVVPYPFGGNLHIPENWIYAYMGALNHFFARKEIADITKEFVETVLKKSGNRWQIFEALAWICGMEIR